MRRLLAWRSVASLLIASSSMLACSSDDHASAASPDPATLDASDPPEPDAPFHEPDSAQAEDAEAIDSSPVDAAPPPPPDRVDPDRLADTLRWLSADDMAGRLTGTASGDRAEAAIVDFLVASGADVKTQEVRFPLYEVGSPIELSVLDDQGERSLAYVDEFREVDFSGQGLVEGELVFVGYGLTLDAHDSYAGLEVQDKVVAVLTGVPSGLGLEPEDDGRLDEKIHAAWEHGAKGVVFVPSGSDLTRDTQDEEGMELWAVDKYGQFDEGLFHDDFPSLFIHGASAEALLGKTPQKLASDPTPFETGTRVRLRATGTVHREAKCNNIFVVLEGQDATLSEEVVLLGAHYDHLGVGADGRVFNGAADNASGTAIVMEVAATLAASPAVPKRTLVLALWCAEEQGLHGSFEYGHYGTPLYPLTDTKLMIQVDYLDNEDGPYITNLDDNPLVTAFLGDAGEHASYPVKGENWFGQCASDDCIFLYKNVPAYRFLSYGQHHHRDNDDYDALNLPIIERVAEVCLQGMGSVGY